MLINKIVFCGLIGLSSAMIAMETVSSTRLERIFKLIHARRADIKAFTYPSGSYGYKLEGAEGTDSLLVRFDNKKNHYVGLVVFRDGDQKEKYDLTKDEALTIFYFMKSLIEPAEGETESVYENP